MSTWPVLADGVNFPAAEYLNNIHTEKLDRDGEIACIGTLMWDKGADIPSANNLQPGADGNYFDVTGTTTIKQITAAQSQPGTWLRFHFDSALTIEHDNDNIVIPWATNLSVKAGDEVLFIEYVANKWRLAGYITSDGLPVYGPGAATDNAIARFDGVTGKVIQSSGITIDDNDIIESIRAAIFKAEYDNGNSGAAKTIDWNNHLKQKITLTDDCVFTFTDPPGPCDVQLKMTHDMVGGADPTWPANVHWQDETEPTWSDDGETDLVRGYFDGADYIFGAITGITL